ncbi:MAG: glycosyltransferase family 39 protein [Acidobacteriota bacterium]|nr:glycosyltransferase family 39 protein [Acidobacteriota bacterium]
MNISNRFRTVILAAICMVYILVRFWDLTTSCLWFDEIFSVHAAEQPWNSLLWFIAQDLIHPPFFYILLKAWMTIGGESISWLRFFPVLLSIIALVPFLLLCRELKFKIWTTALALCFFAVNGSLIKYSQEVRMYSLLLCLSLFSLWLFARFFNLGKNFWLLTLINILLVYTHYFGWLVVLSEVVAILILQRIKIRHILLMSAVAFISFLPWIVVVIQAANIGADVKQNIGWISTPGISSIFELALDLVEPFYYQQSNANPTSVFIVAVPILLLILAAKILFYVNWKNVEDKNPFYLLTLFSAVPIIAAFTASWILPVSIWGSRHLIIVFAPAIILSALFLNEIRSKTVRIVLVSILFTLFGAAFLIRLRTDPPQYIWCAWERLAADLRVAESGATEPARVYVFEDLVAYHFWFALRDSDKFQVNVVKGIEGLTEDAAYFLPRGFETVKTTDENNINGERFWIAFRAEKWELTSPPLSNLLTKGYKVGEPRVIEAGNQKASIAEVSKPGH